MGNGENAVKEQTNLSKAKEDHLAIERLRAVFDRADFHFEIGQCKRCLLGEMLVRQDAHQLFFGDGCGKQCVVNRLTGDVFCTHSFCRR